MNKHARMTSFIQQTSMNSTGLMVCSLPSGGVCSSEEGRHFIILCNKKSRGKAAPGLVDLGANDSIKDPSSCHTFTLLSSEYGLLSSTSFLHGHNVAAAVSTHTTASEARLLLLSLFLKREETSGIRPGDFSLANIVLVYLSHWD